MLIMVSSSQLKIVVGFQWGGFAFFRLFTEMFLGVKVLEIYSIKVFKAVRIECYNIKIDCDDEDNDDNNDHNISGL